MQKGTVSTKMIIEVEVSTSNPIVSSYDIMHKIASILREPQFLETLRDSLPDANIFKIHTGFLGVKFEDSFNGTSVDAMPGKVLEPDL